MIHCWFLGVLIGLMAFLPTALVYGSVTVLQLSVFYCWTFCLKDSACRRL